MLGTSEIIILLVLGGMGFLGIRFLMRKNSSDQRNIEGNNLQNSGRGNLQCPNCGGFKSEKLGTFSRFLGKLFKYGCLLFGGYILGIVASSFLGGNIQVLFIVMAIIIICCLWDFFTTYRPGKASCLLCGFKWWESDYPIGTKIQVRQDLIEKGNIRLEQERLEREKRRRREEEQRRQQGLQ